MREDLLTFRQSVLTTIPRIIADEAEAVRKHIITRTGRGEGINGEFTPYKANPRVPLKKRYYYKEKAGQREPVTLVRRGSGRMLRSIRIDKIQGGQAVVLPRESTRIGRMQHTGTKEAPARPWWGVTPGFRSYLTREFGRKLLAVQTPGDRRRNFRIGITTA